LDTLSRMIDERFATVDQRFAAMDQRSAAMDQHFEDALLVRLETNTATGAVMDAQLGRLAAKTAKGFRHLRWNRFSGRARARRRHRAQAIAVC
jgi:hypothetical protein